MAVTILVKVIPNAKINHLEYEEERLKCRLHAPSLEGKANAALIKFLSEALEIPKRDLKIVRGQKSREKIISIEALSKEEIFAKILHYIQTQR